MYECYVQLMTKMKCPNGQLIWHRGMAELDYYDYKVELNFTAFVRLIIRNMFFPGIKIHTGFTHVLMLHLSRKFNRRTQLQKSVYTFLITISGVTGNTKFHRSKKHFFHILNFLKSGASYISWRLTIDVEHLYCMTKAWITSSCPQH
jgi:hypothetical protein